MAFTLVAERQETELPAMAVIHPKKQSLSGQTGEESLHSDTNKL